MSWHKNSYAMTTHLLFEELGVDYDVSWFNVHQPETFPAEFLELNPNARVPVLVTPDGPIYESAATMVYLSEHHQDRFMPAGNGPERARALQWLFSQLQALVKALRKAISSHQRTLACLRSANYIVSVIRILLPANRLTRGIIRSNT
jgi:glutathione S-transferase